MKETRTVRAIAKEARARFYGLREAALELARATVASAARIRHWQWRSMLPTGYFIPSLPVSWPPAGPSSSSAVRGVATAPKMLLLGLLILQLLVLGVLRSAPSKSAAQQLIQGSAGSRTLYSVPSVKKGPNAGGPGKLDEKILIGPVVAKEKQAQNHNAVSKSKKDSAKKKGGARNSRSNDVSMSTVLDDAASSVSEAHEEEHATHQGSNSQEDEQTALVNSALASQQQEEIPQVQVQHLEVDEEQQEIDKEPEEEAQTQESLVTASETAILEEDPVCKGGRIFVYNLPSMFNSDLVANCSLLNPWVSLCDPLSNGGLGKPMNTTPWPSSRPSPWYYTEQFSGEVIFHTRILQHPCVTNDSESANVFYVPFYAGLDVSRYLWKPSVAEERDYLGRKLIEWLQSQPGWHRNRGRDHFTMIGRITWDFRRTEDKEWGSGLLNMPEMKNMSRLVIEIDPWEGGEYGVPYPTSFHPRTEHELQKWQEFVRNKDRGLVYSFAGATRKRIPNDFRLVLHSQCSAIQGACSFMDCSDSKCETPEPVMQLFLNSSFCLQPRGDSYTRRSIFDSILAGCIPVFFWNQSSYWQYKWYFPDEDESYSVFIDREDVRKGTKIIDVLSKFSEAQVKQMRNNLIDLLPKLVYAAADHQLSGADAFDTAIDGILRTMLKMNLRSNQRKGSG